mgnify:CR=1 FL=1
MGNIKRCTKRIISIVLILTIIINLIPNFSLLQSVLKASDLTSGIILRLNTDKGIWTDGNYSAISLDIIVKDIEFTSFRLPIKFDSSKLKPAYVNNNKLQYASNVREFTEPISSEISQNITAAGEFSETDWKEVDSGKIVLDFYDAKYSNTFSVEGEKLVCTINFIVDDAISDISQINTQLININNENDLFLIYNYNEEEYLNDINRYFLLEGVIISPTIASIAIETNPTDSKIFEHGDAIDLTTGTLLATYTDGSTKQISMMDTDVTVKVGDKVGAFADYNNPKLTFEYKGKSVDLDISVIDVVEKIAFYDKDGVLNNINFMGGDEIPKEDLYIKTISKTGVIDELKLSDAHITLDSDVADANKILNPYFDSSIGEASGIQAIKIIYQDEHVTKTTAFNILVNDRVGSIKISTINAPKTKYVVNDKFEKNGAIEIIGESTGKSYGEINISSDNVTVVEENGAEVDLTKPVTSKNLKVIFAGKEASYTIDVENVVKAIKINASEVLLKYNQAIEANDLVGITVTEILADGTEGQTFPLDISWLDTSNYNNAIVTMQKLKVSYPYNGSIIEGILDVRVKDELIGITINNFITDYKYKEELDFTGAKFTTEYVSGTYGPLDFEKDDLQITGFDNQIIGSQNLTFTYNDGEKSASTNYTINISKGTLIAPTCNRLEIIENHLLSEIENQLPSDEYGTVVWKNPNEKLIGTGIKEVSAIYKMNNTYSPYYEDVELTVEVEVIPKEVSSIAITTAPSKTTYFEGQAFNPNGMVIEVTYNDGEKAIIDSDYEINGVTYTPSTGLQTTDTTVTVVYREKTATQAIIVNPDYIADITITAPSKLEYKYGDSIDLTGATITKIWASGIAHTGDTIDMTKDMLSSTTLSSFDVMNLGTHSIEVTFNGITSSNTFSIIVKDYVSSIEIKDKSKLQTEYLYGDTINVQDKTTGADLYIVVKYAGGTPDDEVKITTNMVSGFDTTRVEDNQVVTVTYEGCTDSYTINVKDKVVGIEISTIPTKKIYKLNETSDFSDIVVINKMGSGLIGTTLATSEYTITGFDSSSIGEKIITVTKNGTSFKDTFTIKVIDTTTGIYISDLPKQNYLYGENLDITSGKVTIRTQSNPTGQTIPLTDASITVTGYVPNKLGNQILTVTYTYQEETDNGIETKTLTDTYTVTVKDYWTGKILITALPDKLKYKYGEDIDLTGGKIAKIMVSGAKEDETAITGEMISGYSKTTIGTQTITITHWGKSVTYNITLVDEMIGISMNTLPSKVEYTKGQSIDVTGATINVTKNSGITVIPLTMQMISGYDPNKTGKQVITVSYEGKTTQFIVNVKEATVKPTKPSNNKPNVSNTTTYVVTFINYDGTVIKTEKVVKGSAATAPEIEVRKGYKFIGWDKTFDRVEADITVIAQYEKIITAEINTPENIEVIKGKEIDLSEVTLVIKDDEGNVIKEIPVTKDMISRFDSEKLGTQMVTVTYMDENGERYITTFSVRVIKPVETLGEKDKQEDTNNIKDTLVPATIGLGVTGLLLLLIAAITKKNVQIYAITNEGKRLIGKERISRKNKVILLDAYKTELENANAIELKVNSKVVEKLNNETIEVVKDGVKQEYKVSETIEIK